MDRNAEWRETDTFVVRVSRGRDGGLTGFVQHVATGERLPFQALDGLGDIVRRMIGLRPGRRLGADD
jgi:hypothetical protein